MKFHEYSSSVCVCARARRVLCERTDGQTGMSTLIVAFRNFANASKKCQSEHLTLISPLWDLGENAGYY